MSFGSRFAAWIYRRKMSTRGIMRRFSAHRIERWEDQHTFPGFGIWLSPTGIY